jgi:hypothetical protein
LELTDRENPTSKWTVTFLKPSSLETLLGMQEREKGKMRCMANGENNG